MKRLLVFNLVVRHCLAIFKLLAGPDEALFVAGDIFTALDDALDVVDCVAGVDSQSDGLAIQGLHEKMLAFLLVQNMKSKIK